MRSRKVLTLFTAAALFLSLSVPIFAAEGVVSVGEGGVLRMRRAADSSSAVIDTLPDGKRVEILDEADGWYHIRVNDLEGYVSARYVTAEEEDIYLKVTTASLNIRSAADSSASRVGALNEGDVVKALEKLDGWYRIEQGYISARYVAVTDKPAEPEPEPEPEDIYLKVTTASLNIRSAANSSASRVGALNEGDVVKVLEALDGWYRIEQGYISARYVKQTDKPADPEPEPEPEPEDIYLKVTTASLNIRSAADSSASRVGALREGDVVKALEALDGWYRIEQGYISARYVKQTDKPADPQPKPEPEPEPEPEPIPASSVGEAMAALAQTFVGYRYVYGGESPKIGFDCSGLVQYVCAQYGYSINRTASAQLDNGVAVSRDELAPGDLVFFKKPTIKSSKPVSHVGMYIGDGKFVHASDYDTGVKISKLTDSYYTVGWVAARRIAT